MLFLCRGAHPSQNFCSVGGVSRKERAINFRTLFGTLTLAALVTGCGSALPQSPVEVQENVNQNIPVAARFGTTPQVLSDPQQSGVQAAQTIFEKSETAVISGPSVAAQARAASISIVAHAPMMVSTPETSADVVATLGKLGVTHVLMVGDATPLNLQRIETVVDPGTAEGIGELTSLAFQRRETQNLLRDLVHTDPNLPTEFTVPGHSLPPSGEKAKSFPVQSKQDGGAAPPVLATADSSIAAVATARAFGANVTFLENVDPRFNAETVTATAGLANQPMLALGDAFGIADELARRIRSAAHSPQQPGGGGLVFPGRRIVALYGHPSGPALGELGEQPLEASVAEVKERAKQYQAHSEETVVPAFEIIATVAASQPGADGDYSNESTVEELSPYVDAITNAGGYAILDLQPGRASFLDQAKRYEELLKRPNVGLALDPEWKLYGQEKPMQDVGHVSAGEINDVSRWLADLTRDNDVPQKPLVVHQFQTQMIRDRDQLQFHDEIALIIHVDGHGARGEKLGTWDEIRKGLDPRIFLAWKNFHDEDKPMFTPKETMDTEPRPWLVTYQ